MLTYLIKTDILLCNEWDAVQGHRYVQHVSTRKETGFRFLVVSNFVIYTFKTIRLPGSRVRMLFIDEQAPDSISGSAVRLFYSVGFFFTGCQCVVIEA